MTEPCSATQLLALPRGRCRYELVAGELRRMTPAGHEHGRVAINAAWRLAAHGTRHQLGTVFTAETGFQLATEPDTVRAPNVAFVTRERAEAVRGRPGYFPGAPDLAVEVVSPNDSYSEVVEKVEAWLAAGCRTVVVVDPRLRTAAIHTPGQPLVSLDTADRLHLAAIVPGFDLLVGDLFA